MNSYLSVISLHTIITASKEFLSKEAAENSNLLLGKLQAIHMLLSNAIIP